MTKAPQRSAEASPILLAEGLQDGVWHGCLQGLSKARKAPVLLASLNGLDLPVEALPREGVASTWDVRVPVPVSALATGTQALMISLEGVALLSVVIQIGPASADDPAAQIAVLRAEVELLKRVLRRHLRDSASA